MRVLHVIPSVAHRDGGPATAIRGMSAALAERGVEVTVATTNADGPASLDVPLDRAVIESGVEYRYFARTVPGEYKFSWALTRWLRESLPSFDVVHVHALFSYTTIPACRFAARFAIPFVLRPLGTLGAWSLSHRGWKKAPYLALVERRHLRDASILHATSDSEADALSALGYGRKTRVIPLGVPLLDEPLHAVAGVRAREAGSSSPFRLLFLSRLHPVKNVPLLLDAVARLRSLTERPVRLTIAGDGATEYVTELRAKSTALGLDASVHFVGRLEGANKIAALDESDLFVLPSSHENFGIAAAEALGRGLPVMLSEDVGIAPDVARVAAGVVVARDAATMAASLARLAEQPDALAAMRASALALARERYSWTACAASLETLYSGLAAADGVQAT